MGEDDGSRFLSRTRSFSPADVRDDGTHKDFARVLWPPSCINHKASFGTLMARFICFHG